MCTMALDTNSRVAHHSEKTRVPTTILPPAPMTPSEDLSSAAPRALEGVKVLDLSRVLAGPYCGQLLADFGAEVIKVEDVTGDENRRWEPIIDGQSANYLSVNRGKRAMTLNLKSSEGQDILRKLVARSDVVITSFLPEVARRLGVDDDSLRRARPSLVHISISGYGDTGPLRGRPGYDLMLQAFTGMMSITGELGGGPIRSGASVIDMATGILAYSGVMTALFARQRGTVEGQHVQVSLLETGMALLGYHLVDHAANGRQPVRGGSGMWSIVPYQAFDTQDGAILAGATNDAAWRRLCQALGLAALAADPSYASAASRIAHRAPLIERLQTQFRSRTTTEWMTRLDAAGVPCAPIHDIGQALAHPQVAATQMVVRATDARGLERHMVGVPVKMAGTPAVAGTAPPYLGQHTDALLAELFGMDTADLDKLRSKGVI